MIFSSCPVLVKVRNFSFARFWQKHSLWLGLVFVALLLAALSPLIKNSGLTSNGLRQGLNLKKSVPTPAPYPVNINEVFPPPLTASSIMIKDTDSMVSLYEKDPSLRLFPASTTKIMTALVALENFPLEQVLVVGNHPVEGNTIKLLAGEEMTVENLLNGLLIGSGNDAALVLAENFPGGLEGFVWAMNQKAKELKMENTHFTNPMGFDQGEHYSTAEDLVRLAIFALKDPVISRIVSTSELTITDVSGAIAHPLKNTNELVGKLEGVKGVKTGWTENAGECLITFIEREDRQVVMVVLGSKDRFGETKTLIDWVFNNFSWETIGLTTDR
jgi:D-alanyl-D-alanine carboxypeptidase